MKHVLQVRPSGLRSRLAAGQIAAEGMKTIADHATPFAQSDGRPPDRTLPPGANFVDAFVLDVNGIARGKRLPSVEFVAASGVAFSAGALVLDARGMMQGPLGIGTQDGDPDGLGLLVPGTLQPVPWAKPAGQVAQCLLSMHRDGAPLWYDPRQVLSDIVARCRADGLHPVVACELEFYLVEVDAAGCPHPPHAGTRDQSGHLCLQHLERNSALLHDLHAALAAQGISAGTLVSEYGPGQFEVNLTHGPDPVLAADQAALLRRAAQGVAAAHGQRATFMAKPYPRHAGSGLHIHVSLNDDVGLKPTGHNRFGAAGGQALLEHAIGGMQALLPASMALLAPSFSAYRRYQPGAFVANGGSWGENSRAAAFRIPPGGATSRRIEHRVACADASPHLAMACVLAALHYGITKRLAPLPAGVEMAGVPMDFLGALARFEADATLASYLPARFQAMFAALKRTETAELLGEVSPAEFAWYL
jgi:glutamine synthetase